MENQNLDLIEPRGVLGREVEGDAVTGIAQECLACRHRLEDAGYPLLPRSSLMPLRSATRRVSPSDMWVLRLSQTTCYRAVDAEANRFSSNDTKSASVRAIANGAADFAPRRHQTQRSGLSCHGGNTRTPAVRRAQADDAAGHRLAGQFALTPMTDRDISGSGFSQASAIIRQITAGVNAAGAPQRGASLRRAATPADGAASRPTGAASHRRSCAKSPSGCAVSSMPKPAAARKTIRARSANLCGVECARTKSFSCRSYSSDNCTGEAL